MVDVVAQHVGGPASSPARRWWTGAAALVLAGAGSAWGPVTPVAAADDSADRGRPVQVVAGGFDAPLGLDVKRRGILVADAFAGEVSLTRHHRTRRVLISDAPGASGVAGGHKRVFAVLGGPNEGGEPPPGDYEPTSVLATGYGGGRVEVIANLLDYELANNPDGQVQFVDGNPVDALSNPFSMALSKRGLLVADGGANAVLRVHPGTGKVSTFFVPPTVTRVRACLEEGAQANPGTRGCDSVPTGVAVRGGSVYISTLGAEVPRAGRVYQVGLRSGKVRRVWRNLTAPTGVAVRGKAVYVSEVLYNLPQGPPPADFDIATAGRITKLAGGRRTSAQVTLPTGLDVRRGRLYSTAWSVAALFLGPDGEGEGRVVRVRRSAFR